MQVKLAENDEQLRQIIPVMLELRPQYSKDALLEQMLLQQSNGYRVAYVEDDEGRVVTVAGFVVSQKLAWQKHVYVDDLVSSEAHRSRGAGKLLLDWLKAYACEQGCQQLHLDSGVTRYAAHRFYLREGFNITSHHFAVTDLNED